MTDVDARRTEVARVEPRGEVAEVRPEALPPLVRLALEKGHPVDVIRDLIALQREVAAEAARIAFFAALAALKAELPPIPKVKAIKVDRDGVPTVRSRFAPLSVIAETIREPLARHGFAYYWTSSVDEKGYCTVFCHLHHVEGHEIVSSFSFREKDAAAPKMNGVQISGSARSYGERYSLVQALGLTTADVDDDGNSAGLDDEEREPVTPEQEATLRAMVREVGADEARFVAHMARSAGAPLESLADIPADLYQTAIRLLEDKRRAAS